MQIDCTVIAIGSKYLNDNLHVLLSRLTAIATSMSSHRLTEMQHRS